MYDETFDHYEFVIRESVQQKILMLNKENFLSESILPLSQHIDGFHSQQSAFSQTQSVSG